MGEKGGYISLMIKARYTFYDWRLIDELLKLSLTDVFTPILDTSATVGKTIRIHPSAGGAPAEVASTTSALMVRKIFILRKVKVGCYIPYKRH